MKVTRDGLRQIINEELKILEGCCAVKSGKKPCSACMKGGSCGGHARQNQGGHKKHDREGRMTKGNLYHMMKYASKVYDMIEDDDDLPEWVQSKVARAADKISSVYEYLEYKIKHHDR